MNNTPPNAIIGSTREFIEIQGLVQSDTLNGNNRVLDLVLSNYELKVDHSEHPIVNEDDHHPALEIVMRGNNRTEIHGEQYHGAEYRYNYGMTDFDLLYRLLLDCTWAELETCETVDEMVDVFYSIINSCIEQSVPRRQIRCTVNKFPCWYDQKTISTLKTKNYYYRRKNLSNYHNRRYRFHRAELKRQSEVAYRNYVLTIQNNVSSGQINAFWGFVKNRKSGKTDFTGLKVEGGKTTDARRIAKASIITAAQHIIIIILGMVA